MPVGPDARGGSGGGAGGRFDAHGAADGAASRRSKSTSWLPVVPATKRSLACGLKRTDCTKAWSGTAQQPHARPVDMSYRRTVWSYAPESSSDESEDGETSTTELSQLISPDSQQQMPRTVRSRRRHSNTLHDIWKDTDSNYMKPLFGGSRDDGKSSWQPEQ